MQSQILKDYFPQNFPTTMSGKLTSKIIIKSDYIRTDGTCALYMQIFLHKKQKRIPLDISVKPKDFDKKKQLIKGKSQTVNDMNLVIKKFQSDLSQIAIAYRLSGAVLTVDKIEEELTNPTSRLDFLKFFKQELEKQKNIIKPATYKQQFSNYTKLKEWKKKWFFYDVTIDNINKFKKHCKDNLKNKPITIQTSMKNLKKYLRIAKKKGIAIPLDLDELKVEKIKGSRTFLDEYEVTLLYKYKTSVFCSEVHKNILDRFLFACFTGLRISDILRVDRNSIVGDHLVFIAEKTGKLQRILLSDTAKKFIQNKGPVFKGNYTEQHINRELKFIAKACSIKKNISFHVSRHTFATNFLMKGGRIEVLQKLLAHSNIRETMIYVHVVQSLKDEEILKLDSVINLN